MFYWQLWDQQNSFLICFEFLKLTIAETNEPQGKFLKFIEVVIVISIFSIFTPALLCNMQMSFCQYVTLCVPLVFGFD